MFYGDYKGIEKIMMRNNRSRIIYIIQLIFIIAISASGVIYMQKQCDMQQGGCFYSYIDIYMNSISSKVNVIIASQLLLISYLFNIEYTSSPNVLVRLSERENILWNILKNGIIMSVLYGIVALVISILTGIVIKGEYSSGRVCNYDNYNSIYYLFTGRTESHLLLVVVKIMLILICSVLFRYLVGVMISFVVRKKCFIFIISLMSNALIPDRLIFKPVSKIIGQVYRLYSDTSESVIIICSMIIGIVMCIILSRIFIRKRDWI